MSEEKYNELYSKFKPVGYKTTYADDLITNGEFIMIYGKRDICKVLVFIMLVLPFQGCHKPNEGEDFKIKLTGVGLYLKEPETGDARRPPRIHFQFEAQNLNSYKQLLMTKAAANDDRNSKLLMLDTLKNIIIPIYSNSLPVMEGAEVAEVFNSIDMRDLSEYMKLDEVFFDKIDFSNNAQLLKKIVSEMVNNSIIIYVPDSNDTKRYLLMDEVYPAYKSSLIRVDKSPVYDKKTGKVNVVINN